MCVLTSGVIYVFVQRMACIIDIQVKIIQVVTNIEYSICRMVGEIVYKIFFKLRKQVYI